jgi:hypothetical protein
MPKSKKVDNLFVDLVSSSDELHDIHKDVFIRIHDRLKSADMLNDAMLGDLYLLVVSVGSTGIPPVVFYDHAARGDLDTLRDRTRARIDRARVNITKAGRDVMAFATVVDHATVSALSKTKRIAVALPAVISKTVREA